MCLAVPGKIIGINDSEPEIVGRYGKISFDGIVKDINLDFVPEAHVGEYVLVHVGVAISRVDEREAREVMEFLKELGDFDGLDELETSREL